MAHNGPRVEQHAERVARRVHLRIERLARFGYVAYGVVYLLVGVLAMQAAFGGAAEAAGQQSALRSVLVAPLGRVPLCIIALGLLAYTAWRLYQGVMDPENEGSDLKGIAKRLDYVINGLFHGAIAFYAGQLAFGAGAVARRTTGRRL